MEIFTNNPQVREHLGDRYAIRFIDGEYKDVLNATKRAIVDEQLVMLTHPLSGSIKPNETYYKSIVLMEQRNPSTDLESLEYIEHAIDTHNKFEQIARRPQWNDRILEDFAVIDYDLIQSALEQIKVPPAYL